MASKNAKMDENSEISVNIPPDGHCLFWAVTMAFLFPIKDNTDEFRDRIKKLFPNISDSEIHEIHESLKGYNPLILTVNTNVLANIQTLKELVTKTVRENVVEHMSENEEMYKQLIQQEINDSKYLKERKITTNFKYLKNMVNSLRTVFLKYVQTIFFFKNLKIYDGT